MIEHHSLLYPFIIQYIDLKQALGYPYNKEKSFLLLLDRFIIKNNEQDLSIDNFYKYFQTKEHLSSGVLRRQMFVVRNLCLYRQRFEPACFIPEKHWFPEPHQPIRAYIFNDEQINCLLKAAEGLCKIPISPIRPAVFHLAIVLLYTSGLRSGELLRLTIGDYDPINHVLTISNTKFKSTRYLPLSSDAIDEMQVYLSIRRKNNLDMGANAPLIGHLQQGGRAYTSISLINVFHKLCDECGIRKDDGHLPRIHDVRHCFAVNALLRWYKQGDNPQAKLPLLATYMGHSSIASTAYYLSFIDEISGESCKRFSTYFGNFVPHGQQKKESNDE